jgi:hypothetical protein
MWRQRRWRKLLNVIDHLPRHSALTEAIADDEALAAVLLESPPAKTGARRRMSEYTAEVETLSAAVDRLGELIQVVAATRGAKARRIPPAPRPVTAMDRLRARRRIDKHYAVVARVLPHKAGQQSVQGAPDGVRRWHGVVADPAQLQQHRKGDGGRRPQAGRQTS